MNFGGHSLFYSSGIAGFKMPATTGFKIELKMKKIFK
jgi:hypothetical protein